MCKCGICETDCDYHKPSNPFDSYDPWKPAYASNGIRLVPEGEGILDTNFTSDSTANFSDLLKQMYPHPQQAINNYVFSGKTEFKGLSGWIPAVEKEDDGTEIGVYYSYHPKYNAKAVL